MRIACHTVGGNNHSTVQSGETPCQFVCHLLRGKWPDRFNAIFFCENAAYRVYT